METKLWHKSADLLNEGPFKLGHVAYDRLFLLVNANPQTFDDEYRFVIDRDTPTVRLNSTLTLPLPTVKEIAHDQNYSLISSNALVDISGYGYPILQRDSEAPVYPLHYTCSAGRCDQSPLNTALAELNQEVLITVRHSVTNELRLLGFGYQAIAEAGKTHKERSLGKSLPEVLVVPVTWNNDQKNRYRLVIVDDERKQVVEDGSALVIYDRNANTYELCFKGSASLPDGWIISRVSDGEGFGREASIVKKLTYLKDLPCVPALKAIIEQLE